MEFFDQPYYRTGKNVTRLIGRWPYQKRWESKIYSFVIVILFNTQVIGQILGLIVYFDDNEIILELISPFMIDIIMSAKFLNFIINIKTMKKLLDRLKENCSLQTKEEEKNILDEYAYSGQLIVYGYIIAVYITTSVFIIEPLISKWINLVLQLNETVLNKYPVTIYYYEIDMEKNFTLIFCYESLCIFAILTITVANDSMFIIFLQHACGLFTVVGHQLKNLPKNYNLNKVSNNDKGSTQTKDIHYDYYIMCIQNHKRAVEFANLIEDLYVWSFGVVIAINMPLMSVTAVQLMTQADTIQKKIKYSMFACTQMMHLFFDCYLSQRLSDSSVAIQEYITFSKWYGMPLKMQKLITMVTLRSQIPCKLTAGKLVILSMETFGVFKTVEIYMSYFHAYRTIALGTYSYDTSSLGESFFAPESERNPNFRNFRGITEKI
ncbi:hypothetical protein PV328_002783 [Microctonus aethiopoides]|uniref:Odorant receptor n=1 Tax=Microctonus aethiopoides TaxID=144406 RepID=A0AA39F712_9HYME|nr:hypothetical protein PV328_002783 [Microctonus aethiopoides]